MSPQKKDRRRKRLSSSRPPKQTPSRIILRFKRGSVLPYVDDAHRYLDKTNRLFWDQISDQFGTMSLRRLFTRVTPEQIKKLTEKAESLSPSYVAPDFLKYYVVSCPPGAHPEELAKAFRKWQIVEHAYVSLHFSVASPPVDPSDEMNNRGNYVYQSYLQAAPGGVDAYYVWPKVDGTGFAGGSGANQRLLDIEYGWRLDHEDLIGHNITPPSTDPYSTNALYRDHGTKVLGVIAAIDNDRGCLGIVPDVGSILVEPVQDQDEIANVAEAALSKLSAGDVLLIELHVRLERPGYSDIWVPIEVQDDIFIVLEKAYNLGITVIEPAGTQWWVNGEELDKLEFAGPGGSNLRLLDRNGGVAVGFRDSGAILVSGSECIPTGNSYSRDSNCNWGSRVDCFAHGDKVTTCDTTDVCPTKAYTDEFCGASSASAIIAGVALAVQGLSENNAGFRYLPSLLRNILSDPSTGTLSVSNEIGVMPDLRKISKKLGIAPDVYMRDWPGDTGDPHNGPLSCSPDIILQNSPIPPGQNPQDVYGEGSGTENNQALSDEVDPQQDNYIYLRVRNRGYYPAANVEVRVYWATVSTLPLPGDWTLIGNDIIPSVPPGNTLKVSNAIKWNQGDIPGPGHYCFIAVIDTPEDPAPDPAVLTDWQSFLDYVAKNNNVTWRNFNIIPFQPAPPLPLPIFPANPNVPDQYAMLPFDISGPARRGLETNIEICSKLPMGASIWLVAATPLANRLCNESPYNLKSKDRERTCVRLNPCGHNALNPIFMPPGVRMRLELLVQVPRNKEITGSYECYVRQLYQKREIGRVTWRLVQPPPGKTRKPKKKQTRMGRSKARRFR